MGFWFFSTLLSASTLYMALNANPSRINPILSTDGASSEISDWIFSGLLKYDKDGKIVPDIAKEYYFEDNQTLVFKLRDGVKWHDGEKVTAQDVIFTFETITSPKIFTPYAQSYKFVEKIEKIDDLTLRVKYKNPYFRALEIWLVGLLPHHILKNEKDLMSSKFNQEPIGTGPYTLKKLEISKKVELNAFRDYYDGEPKIKKLVFSFVPDANTEFLMLKSGELDLGALRPIQYKKQLDDSFKNMFDTHELIGRSYSYLGFNLVLDKFKDKRVRDAINLALDRDEMINIMLFGYGKPLNGPFLPSAMGFNKSVEIPKQNIKLAKELLKECGYDEKNPFSFEIATSTGGSSADVAQIIQYQLEKIGVKTTLKSMEWQAFLNTVINPRRFESVLIGWSLSLMPNPRTIWHSSATTKSGFNFISYKNERVDRLIDEAERSSDLEFVDKKFQEIHKLIADDIPTIFLYIPSSIIAVKKNIKGVEPSITGVSHNLPFWEKIE